MSKTFLLVTAAALLASVSAFTEPSLAAGNTDSAVSNQTGNSTNLSTGNKSSATDSTSAKAPAASGKSAVNSGSSTPPRHMRHHGAHRASMTDNVADKLNACMVSGGTPTEEQERCLRRAENAS